MPESEGLDQGREEGCQTLRKQLGPVGLLRKPLCERREAAGIRENNGT